VDLVLNVVIWYLSGKDSGSNPFGTTQVYLSLHVSLMDSNALVQEKG